MMDIARFARLRTLFEQALELSSDQRAALFASACRDDPTLVGEVTVMLAAQERPSFLDGDVAVAAQGILGDAARLVPYETVGGYRLVRRLGDGGMGEVFLAIDLALERQVALKLSPNARISPEQRGRFLREQRTLASLEHPHIVRLYEADVLPDGVPWFAMELVDGRPITAFAAGLPRAERLRLFRELCEAVRYLHDKQVIHCDIKPSNVLVTQAGTVRLLDFGIARVLAEAAPDPWSGIDAMTPAYAAPEQLRGAVGYRTDVYALGVILYELLAGRHPFNASPLTSAETAGLPTRTVPEPPSAAAAPFDVAGARRTSAREWRDLDAICLKAMCPDENGRYDLRDLIADLARFERLEPLQARLEPEKTDRWTALYRARMFAARNRRALAAAAVAVLVIAGLSTLYALGLTAAHEREHSAALRTARTHRFMLGLFRGGGDEDVIPARDMRVTDLLDRGVHDAGALDQEPEAQADLYHLLGTLYENIADFERADSLISKALETRRRLSGNHGARVVESLGGLALVRMDQARLDEGERLAREGLAIAAQIRPFDADTMIRARIALGRVLVAAGDARQALSVLEPALALQPDRSLATPALSDTVNAIANARFDLGDYDGSLELNLQALAIDKQLHGPRHVEVGVDLFNLAEISYAQGRYNEAEAFYRETLDINRAWYSARHPEIGSTLTALAKCLTVQGRSSEALPLLEEARSIYQSAYPATHPRNGLVQNALANVALDTNRLEEAEAGFTSAIAIFTAAHGADHLRTLIGQTNLGRVRLARGDAAGAERLFREVIDRCARAHPGHVQAAAAQALLGEALFRERRFGEAEAEARKAYDTLSTQVQPGMASLQNARKALFESLDALGKTEDAARFRSEFERYRTAGAAPGK